MTKPWLYLAAGVAVGLGLGALVLFGFEYQPWRDSSPAGLQSSEPAPEAGAPAPDFDLVTLSGGSVRLGDLRGKIVLINFWATWCTPCIQEMPNLQKFYKEKFPGRFEVLAINADESISEVQQFVSDMVLTFPILMDPGGRVQQIYRLRGYPTTFFVDEEGIIRYQHIGLLYEDQLADYLSKMGVGE